MFGQLAQSPPGLVGTGPPCLVDLVTLPIELVRALAAPGVRDPMRPGPGVLAADEEPVPGRVQRGAVRAVAGTCPRHQGGQVFGHRHQHLGSPVHRFDGGPGTDAVLPEAPAVPAPHREPVGQRAHRVEVVSQRRDDQARIGINLVPTADKVGIAVTEVLVVGVGPQDQEVGRHIIGPFVPLDELVQGALGPPERLGVGGQETQLGIGVDKEREDAGPVDTFPHHRRRQVFQVTVPGCGPGVVDDAGEGFDAQVRQHRRQGDRIGGHVGEVRHIRPHLVGGSQRRRVVRGSEALFQARQAGQEQTVEGVDAQGAGPQSGDHGRGRLRAPGGQEVADDGRPVDGELEARVPPQRLDGAFQVAAV